MNWKNLLSRLSQPSSVMGLIAIGTAVVTHQAVSADAVIQVASGLGLVAING